MLRAVLPDGGGPAPGVPVTLLDENDNPSGYWVSDQDGLVSMPRSDAASIRVRVGLRSEAPTVLATEALSREIVELPAPRTLLPAAAGERALSSRPRLSGGIDRPPPGEPPGQVLRFVRLAVLPVAAEAPAGAAALLPGAAPADEGGPVDFLDVAEPLGATLRYGALVETEQYWQSLGPVTGDLLYSVALAPGDDARVRVLDGRWPDQEQRPLAALARLIGAPAQVDALAGDDAAVPLEPLTLAPSTGPGGGLGAAALETLRYLGDRVARVSQVLRRRPLRVVEGAGEEPSATALRTLRNPTTDRVVTYHFYEPLERYRVTSRAAQIRPAVLVPFRLPNLATRAVVRQFGSILRRALLDRALDPDLQRMLEPAGGGAGGAQPPVSELRLIVERGPATPDLRQVWCFLHVDNTRYTVHFFPADAKAGVDAPTETPHWIGAIRLADFHQRPLQYPGRLSLQNGSAAMLVFQAVHIEGRIADSWTRLHTVADVVLPPQSQVRLASLSALADAPGVDPREARVLAHLAANLPYYSAAIIAAGDPALRYLALSRIQDPAGAGGGFALADIIENTVVTVVGNYLAFPLRSPEFAPPGLRSALEQYAGRGPRGGGGAPEETVVTIPMPGVWLSVHGAAAAEGESAAAQEDPRQLVRGGRGRVSL